MLRPSYGYMSASKCQFIFLIIFWYSHDKVKPEPVLRGFIADLCVIIRWPHSPRAGRLLEQGSDERDMARAYYDPVGYP